MHQSMSNSSGGMDKMAMKWQTNQGSLEMLRPLTPEIYDYDPLGSTNFSFDTLTPREKAGKLLDHLDQLSGYVQDTERNDWLVEEKLSTFSVFDNIPLQQNYYNSLADTAVVADTDITGDCDLTKLLEANDCQLVQANTCELDHGYAEIKAESPSFLDDLLSPPYTPHPEANDEFVELQNAQTTHHNCGGQPDQDLLYIVANIDDENSSPKGSYSNATLNAQTTHRNGGGQPDQDLLYIVPKIDKNTLPKGSSYPKALFAREADSSDRMCSSYDDDDASSEIVSDSDWSEFELSAKVVVDRVCKRGGGAAAAAKVPKCIPSVANSSAGLQPVPRRRKTFRREMDRKLRKKEQNKDAATRYRLRKKMEVERHKEEERKEAKRNEELKSQLDDTSREIRYLKSLLRQILSNK